MDEVLRWMSRVQYQRVHHIPGQHECFIFRKGISLSKRTKHIKVKYFLIKDYYDTGEVDLRYCPTGRMWADVLTKPLQGQMCRDMWAFLQNCLRDYDDNLERQEDERAHHSTKQQVANVTSSRECVGVQSRNSLKTGRTDSQEIVRPKRDVSLTCVSRFSPYGVSGKEACKDTPELILDRNMDRQRALLPSQ